LQRRDSPLEGLTPAQREAVAHTQGPLLVLAGAGSGKTRVITRRVAHLIDTGVDPRSILAITFTNKASGEMQERIEVLTRGARVWVSTFHAFCARTLRRFASWVDYAPEFTILDGGDQLVAIREALRETGTDPKLFGAPKVLHAIEREKDQLRTPKDTEDDASSLFEQAVARAYAYYQDLLKQSNAMDFTDLLVKTVELLRQDTVRDVLCDRYRHLLIDEYQDTNHAQYQIAKMLASERSNICATGDPDQSIYGWRGADVANILRFEKDYPNALVVKLEENFRSTRLILDAANGLIRRNSDRREKDLITSGEDGQPLRYRIANDEHEEARYVARKVQDRLLDGIPRDEVAVFYRAGSLSRALESAMHERRIPFRVVGSVAFYQRREIKDVLAYLRVVHNCRDDVALKRIINVPPRGVGKTTQAKLRAHGRDHSCGMFEAARALSKSKVLRGRSREGLRTFVEAMDTLRTLASGGASVEEVLRAILEASSYREYLGREYPQDEQDRLMNLEALIAGARDFDRRSGPVAPALGVTPPPASELPLFASLAPDANADDSFAFGANVPDDDAVPEAPGAEDEELGLSGFLGHTALMSSTQDEDDDVARVSLMTIHAAKGLEFDSVFVIGLEDGLFPHSRSLEDGRGLEEERRLAYVAITRAKRRLVLTRANWRTYQGRSTPQRPSVFLREIPAEVFLAGEAPTERELCFTTYSDPNDRHDGVDAPPEELARVGSANDAWDGVDPSHDEEGRPQKPTSGRPGSPAARPWNRALSTANTKPKASPARARLEAPAERKPRIQAFAEKDRIHHEHFGYGTVISVRGKKHRRRAKIRFDEYGLKDLVLQYARMTKLEEK
jgi:DNA helicase II / ATP-dependent DNA helicase PcrA